MSGTSGSDPSPGRHAEDTPVTDQFILGLPSADRLADVDAQTAANELVNAGVTTVDHLSRETRSSLRDREILPFVIDILYREGYLAAGCSASLAVTYSTFAIRSDRLNSVVNGHADRRQLPLLSCVVVVCGLVHLCSDVPAQSTKAGSEASLEAGSTSCSHITWLMSCAGSGTRFTPPTMLHCLCVCDQNISIRRSTSSASVWG
jgi:hypothetical protein